MQEGAGRKWIFSPLVVVILHSGRRRRRRRQLIVFMGNENGPLGEGINWKHRWKALSLPFFPSFLLSRLHTPRSIAPKTFVVVGVNAHVVPPYAPMQRQAAS